jgi:hypothetical protein
MCSCCNRGTSSCLCLQLPLTVCGVIRSSGPDLLCVLIATAELHPVYVPTWRWLCVASLDRVVLIFYHVLVATAVLHPVYVNTERWLYVASLDRVVLIFCVFLCYRGTSSCLCSHLALTVCRVIWSSGPDLLCVLVATAELHPVYVHTGRCTVYGVIRSSGPELLCVLVASAELHPVNVYTERWLCVASLDRVVLIYVFFVATAELSPVYVYTERWLCVASLDRVVLICYVFLLLPWNFILFIFTLNADCVWRH